MNQASHDSEVPAQGQQVITACAFIHHNFNGEEKVFLAKRAETKKFLPGVYELPGGHINFGEELVDGLKREIFEEFGVRIFIGDPFYVFTYTNAVNGSHSIEVIYFAVLEDAVEKIELNPEDHSDSIWIAENEIEKVVSENKKSDDHEVQALRKGFGYLNSRGFIKLN
jgi:8-oxo-dGTP diphosphatase